MTKKSKKVKVEEKSDKPEITWRQRRVLDEVVKGSTYKAAMIKAGFSPNTAVAPTKVTRQPGYLEYKRQVMEKLEEQRQMAIKRMSETVSEANYAEVTNAVHKLTNTLQLLGGGATQNININVRNMTDDELLNSIR